MITLISKWTLCNKADAALIDGLIAAAKAVEAAEAKDGTLMYLVHKTAPNPVDQHHNPKCPAPPPIALSEQTEITFIEQYADATAFSKHLNGQPFNTFKDNFGSYFCEIKNTTFLDQVAGYK